jgi:hypothetical protein
MLSRMKKHCAECGREFTPSSRHRKCSRCRDKAKKHPCPGCGTPISRGSRTCIKCQPPRPTGPANPRWRGGGKPRQSGPRGYIYAKAPGHPRGQRNNGYVFEHILVMEALLGRRLLPGENVHHRNGVRADNRPQNLELWVRGQPSGCRVEDAVAWAREILARYANSPP